MSPLPDASIYGADHDRVPVLIARTYQSRLRGSYEDDMPVTQGWTYRIPLPVPMYTCVIRGSDCQHRAHYIIHGGKGEKFVLNIRFG